MWICIYAMSLVGIGIFASKACFLASLNSNSSNCMKVTYLVDALYPYHHMFILIEKICNFDLFVVFDRTANTIYTFPKKIFNTELYQCFMRCVVCTIGHVSLHMW